MTSSSAHILRHLPTFAAASCGLLVASSLNFLPMREARGQEGGAKKQITQPVEKKANSKKPEHTPEPQIAASKLIECSTSGAKVSTRKEANPMARDAAQRGLNFLAKNAVAWQEQNKCYGCHVQAVTIEAFAVGRHHQYQIEETSYKTVLSGLTTIEGGTRHELGLRYAHGNSLQAPSKAFGGAALGRHDQWVDQSVVEDLLKTAQELLGYQNESGDIRLDWDNAPVGVGSVQGTYQAIQTWKQAYARTADDRWLTAIQKAEGHLQRTLDGWYKTPPAHVQDVNYAVLGLLEAGVGTSEASLVSLRELLLSQQNKDGGWGFQLTEFAGKKGVTGSSGGIFPQKYEQMAGEHGSNPFATGQTLYTLRMLGMSDSDKTIERGTTWLIEHQKKSGGWSEAGFGRAEAMWGVLGLVSLDVLSLDVKGLARGAHLEPKTPINVVAHDNSGAKVVQVELRVDDLAIHRSCGDTLSHALDTSALETGKHIIDVRALNDRGEASTRRFEMYAGDVYLTQLGSSYEEAGTVLSMRDIASTAMTHRVKVAIYSTKESKGKAVADTKLKELSQKGATGPMTFSWDGKNEKGAAQKKGERYLARVELLDEDGKTRQSEELLFVHDSHEAQRQRYAEVSGQLQFGADEMDGVANTTVELLDEDGNVLEKTISTQSGNYRFKNVERDRKYKVRVSKKGYKAQEKELRAAPARPAPKAGEAEPAAAESVDFSL